MARYVAFLRGINIGGRTVKKDRLQEILKAIGMKNVETFRQSGNIVFEASGRPETLRQEIESALARELGYEVAVIVRTTESLETLVKTKAFEGHVEDGSSFLVTMLSTHPAKFPLELPLTIPKSTAVVLASSGMDVFSVTHGGGEGALPNPFLESKLKTKATTRNMNVIRDIVERLGA